MHFILGQNCPHTLIYPFQRPSRDGAFAFPCVWLSRPSLSPTSPLWPQHLISYLLCLWMIFIMLSHAIPSGLRELLCKGVHWKRILVAQGDSDQGSVGCAATLWSGFRKPHKGKLAANIHAQLCGRWRREVWGADEFVIGGEAKVFRPSPPLGTSNIPSVSGMLFSHSQKAI